MRAQTMEGPSPGWRVMAGLLAMTFLVSGTSALVCHQYISFRQFNFWGNALTTVSSAHKSVTCHPDKAACIDAQLKLSIASHTVLVSYQDCKNTKAPSGRSESTTSGDDYFAIQYNVSYCSSDLCNVNVPDMPSQLTEMSTPSNATQCYSKLNFRERETKPSRVICPRASDRCYQGMGNITAGNLTVWLYIRSCQNTCALPPRQIFGPIELNVPEGSCCHGNYCNRKKDAHPTQNNRTRDAPGGSYDEGSVSHTINSTNVDTEDGPHPDFQYDYSNGGDQIVDAALPPFHPREWWGIVARGATVQLSPLLIALGITVLGLWW